MRRAALAVSVLLALTALPGWAGSLEDGIRLVNAGSYEQAIPLLQQAAKANPDNPLPHDYLRQAYEATYRLNDSLAAMEQALTIRKRLAKAAEEAKARQARPVVADESLPPVYVRPGPRKSLPAVTRDSLPKVPTEWKSTLIELPPKPPGSGSDADAKAAAAEPAPAPDAQPVDPAALLPSDARVAPPSLPNPGN